MRKVSAMLAASLPPTGPGTSIGLALAQVVAGREQQQRRESSTRRAVAHAVEQRGQAALADLQRVVFVVVGVEVVAEAAVAQAQAGRAEQRRVERARVDAEAGGDCAHQPLERCPDAARDSRRRADGGVRQCLFARVRRIQSGVAEQHGARAAAEAPAPSMTQRRARQGTASRAGPARRQPALRHRGRRRRRRR